MPSKTLNSGISTLRAYATLDGAEKEYGLLIDVIANTISGQIDDVAAGSYTVNIYIEGQSGLSVYNWPLSSGDAWVQVARGSIPVTVIDATDVSVTFTENDYEYPDADNDGNTNLEELRLGTDPYQAQTFSDVTLGVYSRIQPSCNLFDYLSNPFVDDSVVVRLTKMHVFNSEVYATTESAWQIVGADSNVILEFGMEYSDASNGREKIIFENGMECEFGTYMLSSSKKYSSVDNEIVMFCSNNNKSCVERYRRQQ